MNSFRSSRVNSEGHINFNRYMCQYHFSKIDQVRKARLSRSSPYTNVKRELLKSYEIEYIYAALKGLSSEK